LCSGIVFDREICFEGWTGLIFARSTLMYTQHIIVEFELYGEVQPIILVKPIMRFSKCCEILERRWTV